MYKGLKATSENGDVNILELKNEKNTYSVERVLEVSDHVCEDLEYEIELWIDEEYDCLYLYLNDEYIGKQYKNSSVQFDITEKRIFKDIIGFARFSVKLEKESAPDKWFYSDYVSVLIRPTNKNRNIDEMLKYIYENQEEILTRDVNILSSGNNYNNSYNDFWSQVVLLEGIVKVYEECYTYFKVNSRNKLATVEVVDRADKLQYVDSKTIQYIIQHPEYLRQETNGIRHGKQTFLPTKTLMFQNRMTRDIYENRVVLSFLKHVISDLESFSKNLDEYINGIELANRADNGYIVSSYLIYVNAKEILVSFREKVIELGDKLNQLWVEYSDIFGDIEQELPVCPKPTSIFLTVPQYNRIYTCIHNWYIRSGYELRREKVMLSFMNAPQIYEAYVLVKLINQIQQLGYNLVCAKFVEYPSVGGMKDEPKPYNNTFLFESDGQKITLYYEPHIYCEDRSDINGISLYKNNTIKFDTKTNIEKHNYCYVPDYLFKVSTLDGDRYVICDAKYTYIGKVKSMYFPLLSYKYLFSISTLSKKDCVKGLSIFYGLTDGDAKIENFFDKELNYKIEPFAQIMPLSELMSYSRQDINIKYILEKLLQ
ncbi:MAG: DUF2357 domain-containing protein [Lachnospiraceae bacterium]|nr:DUF2357 domain-containing protein [Lachnospiraceae bacterium]